MGILELISMKNTKGHEDLFNRFQSNYFVIDLSTVDNPKVRSKLSFPFVDNYNHEQTGNVNTDYYSLRQRTAS